MGFVEPEKAVLGSLCVKLRAYLFASIFNAFFLARKHSTEINFNFSLSVHCAKARFESDFGCGVGFFLLGLSIHGS